MDILLIHEEAVTPKRCLQLTRKCRSRSASFAGGHSGGSAGSIGYPRWLDAARVGRLGRV